MHGRIAKRDARRSRPGAVHLGWLLLKESTRMYAQRGQSSPEFFWAKRDKNSKDSEHRSQHAAMIIICTELQLRSSNA